MTFKGRFSKRSVYNKIRDEIFQGNAEWFFVAREQLTEEFYRNSMHEAASYYGQGRLRDGDPLFSQVIMLGSPELHRALLCHVANMSGKGIYCLEHVLYRKIGDFNNALIKAGYPIVRFKQHGDRGHLTRTFVVGLDDEKIKEHDENPIWERQSGEIIGRRTQKNSKEKKTEEVEAVSSESMEQDPMEQQIKSGIIKALESIIADLNK